MKKTRFSETKIVSILKKQEAGIPTLDLCKEHRISQATFRNWKIKYGGMSVEEVKRLKVLKADQEELVTLWLPEKVYEVDESNAIKALQVAEGEINYSKKKRK